MSTHYFIDEDGYTQRTTVPTQHARRPRGLRTIATGAAIIGAAAIITATGGPAPAAEIITDEMIAEIRGELYSQESPVPVSDSVEPCELEDSTGCFWDAGARGNGEGTDFYISPDGVMYSAGAVFEESGVWYVVK